MEERPQGPAADEGRTDEGRAAPRFDTEDERRARPATPTTAPARSWQSRARLRVLLIALAALAAIVALVWYLSTRNTATPATPIPPPSGAGEVTPASTPTTQTPSASPDANAPSATPSSSSTPTPEVSASDAQGRLLVPVAGVTPEQLRDTFTESRSGGRAHDAIDIIAPRGTPVVAAADGRVVKLFQSEPGGITLYQLDPDNRTIYYYAHLERYADGLTEGQYARRGQTIAYVGDTGNAGPGNCHLHFSVSLVSDPARWWDGQHVNPYPLLTGKN